MEWRKLTYSLCPSCDACPTVEIHEGEVRIGEGDNLVRLSKEEWNRLVEGVKSGHLKPLS